MLGRIAPGTASAGRVVAALAEAVGSGDHTRLQSALKALADFGPAAEPAIPALVQTLRETLTRKDRFYPHEGELIAGALAKIAPRTRSAGEVIATLAEVVQSEQASRRAGVADALGEFGPAAEPAIPALVQTLRDDLARKDDEPYFYGISAVRALGRIAPGTSSADGAISALIEALDLRPEFRLGTRVTAIETLRAFGAEAARALPRLRVLRNDSDLSLRRAAGRAVSAIEAAGSGKRDEDVDRSQ
jgi:hypothetical protein